MQPNKVVISSDRCKISEVHNGCKRYRMTADGLTGAANGHEDCYGTFKKLVRNSEFSRSDNFKELSVLAQILSFS